jgi:hypothetical protein
MLDMITALSLTQHVAVPVHLSSEVSYTWWFPEAGYINQVILGKQVTECTGT